jgi:hypothetical protein
MHLLLKYLENLRNKKKTKVFILLILILIIFGISFKFSTGVNPFVYFNF